MYYDLATDYGTVTSDPGAPSCAFYEMHSVTGTNLNLLVTPAATCASMAHSAKCNCQAICKQCSSNMTQACQVILYSFSNFFILTSPISCRTHMNLANISSIQVVMSADID